MSDKLSTQNYKGTRDYFPEEKRVQNYIFNTWRKVAESFGYEEYGAPLLEPLDIYTAKSGQELAGEQTYAFEDRGGRMVAIRPEMTPSISRMVALKRQELPMPARLYSIANFMRYERPQRGRDREFWQLNVDLFGVDGSMADAEMIELAHQLVMAFGAEQEMFSVRINNRQLIDQLMKQFLELDNVATTKMMKLLDRKNKMSDEVFKAQALEVLGEQTEVGWRKVEQLLNIKSFDDLPEEFANSADVIQIKQVMELLQQKGITNAVFDITLMRGLDYYTGLVFELFDESPDNKRSIAGGGRYDGLVGLFGVEPVATTGLGMGESTLQLFLETHKLMPEIKTSTDVYIIPIDESAEAGADKLARELRSEGVLVELDITSRKIDKQLKTAVKKGIPFVAFVGEEELESGVYTVKNLTDSTEQKMDAVRMVTVVKDHRYGGDEDAVFEV